MVSSIGPREELETIDILLVVDLLRAVVSERNKQDLNAHGIDEHVGKHPKTIRIPRIVKI